MMPNRRQIEVELKQKHPNYNLDEKMFYKRMRQGFKFTVNGNVAKIKKGVVIHCMIPLEEIQNFMSDYYPEYAI